MSYGVYSYVKHLLLVSALLAGCGADSFSTATRPAGEDARSSVEADAGPVVTGTGGAQATGGASATGGVVTVEAGGSATGGALDDGGELGADSGSGGEPVSDGSSQGTGGSFHGTGGSSQETGGSSQSGGAPSTGGSPATGGAPTTGGLTGTGGAPPECAPGDKECASDTQPKTCDASGKWVLDAPCPEQTEQCSAGECVYLCCGQSICKLGSVGYCSASSAGSPSCAGGCYLGHACTFGTVKACP